MLQAHAAYGLVDSIRVDKLNYGGAFEASRSFCTLIWLILIHCHKTVPLNMRSRTTMIHVPLMSRGNQKICTSKPFYVVIIETN